MGKKVKNTPNSTTDIKADIDSMFKTKKKDIKKEAKKPELKK